MLLTLEIWKNQRELQETCGHSQFGSCITECPSCKTYGFYAAYQDKERKYVLCKWCGFGQQVDSEPYQCFFEICKECYPLEIRKVFKKSKSISDSNVVGLRFTQFPGHPCPKCSTKMDVWGEDFNPMEGAQRRDLRNTSICSALMET